MRKPALVASNFVPEHCPSENHVINSAQGKHEQGKSALTWPARSSDGLLSQLCTQETEQSHLLAINLGVPVLIHFCHKEMQPENTKGFQEREGQLLSHQSCFLMEFPSAVNLLMNIRKLKVHIR